MCTKHRFSETALYFDDVPAALTSNIRSAESINSTLARRRLPAPASPGQEQHWKAAVDSNRQCAGSHIYHRAWLVVGSNQQRRSQ